jgi:hypothetical protein
MRNKKNTIVLLTENMLFWTHNKLGIILYTLFRQKFFTES